MNAKKKLKSASYFKKLQDLPKVVYSFGFIIEDNKIYIFGGSIKPYKDWVLVFAY